MKNLICVKTSCCADRASFEICKRGWEFGKQKSCDICGWLLQKDPMSASVIPQTASDAWSWNQRWNQRWLARLRLSVRLFWHISTSCAFLPSLWQLTHKVPTQPCLTNSADFFLSLSSFTSVNYDGTFVLFGHFCTSLESWPSGRLSKKFTSSRSSVVPCCPRHMGNRVKIIPINLPLARHLLQFVLGNGEVFPRQLRSIIWSPPSQMYPKVPYQLPEDIRVRYL